MFRSRLAFAGVAVAAAAGLVLVPSAATGHTDNLFTWVGTDDGSGFGTTSKTDAALTALSVEAGLELEVASGVEVCNEVGYAVGGRLDGSGTPAIVTWDHSTGALLSEPVDLWIEGGDVDGVVELDTLADCSILTIAFLEGEVPEAALVSVDLATGELAIVADLTSSPQLPSGVATNAAGTTFVFAGDYGVNGVFTTVDVTTGALGAPWTELGGLIEFFEGGGPLFGVDFDASDTMWLIIGADSEETHYLVSFAAGADLATAQPTEIGSYAFEGEDVIASTPFPLAAEGHTPVPAPGSEPQLAATGAELPAGIVLGAGILLLTGAALLIARRRTAQ